jgi:hypothetical protein
MNWQPTWRRLTASTLVLFVLMLAVLVWRVEAGEDPALGATSSAGAESGSSTGVVPATPGAAAPGFAPGGGGGGSRSGGSGSGPSQSQSQAPSPSDGAGGAPSTHQS